MATKKSCGLYLIAQVGKETKNERETYRILAIHVETSRNLLDKHEMSITYTKKKPKEEFAKKKILPELNSMIMVLFNFRISLNYFTFSAHIV